MPNPYFRFKEFIINQDQCAMKVCTDACLFGAWTAKQIASVDMEEGKMLDIGAGTGLLSLMIAQKKNLATDLVEIDEMATLQAKENCAASPWAKNITVHQADISNYKKDYQYDVIISNPPFYENDLKATDPRKNTAHHNDHLELDDLLSVIKGKLKPGGQFFLLFPFKRWPELEEKIKQQQLHINQSVFVHKSFNLPPFRIMIRGSFNKNEEAPSAIYIWNEEQQYTSGFIELLKDYYLYL